MNEIGLGEFGPGIRPLFWIGFLLFLIIYGVFSAIVVYHWRKYAIGADIISQTLRWYFITTGALLVVAFAALIFI